MNITDTSKEAYEAAAERHVAAFNAVTKARKALVDAEIELELAENALCRHEYRPGVPLYTVTEDNDCDICQTTNGCRCNEGNR